MIFFVFNYVFAIIIVVVLGWWNYFESCCWNCCGWIILLLR